MLFLSKYQLFIQQIIYLGDCVEFPVDADPILNVIYSIKGVPNDGSRNQNVENPEAASLSSLSNSVDSGIVFRDDTNQVY